METLRDLEVVRAVSSRVRAKQRDDAPDAGGMPTMEVRFSPYGVWYEIASYFEGRFLERTVKGAFKRSIDRGLPGVQALFNHGFDPQIGDKVLGPIRSVTEEDDSPLGVVDLLDTSYNRDLIPGLEAGVYGSSFRFVVIQDAWNDEPGRSEHNPDGIPERTITEVRLMEFGPVTFPANPAATSGVRSLTDVFYQQLRARDPQRVDELELRTQTLRTPTLTAPGSPAAVLLEPGPATNDPSDPARSHSHGVRARELRERAYPYLTRKDEA